MAAYMAEAARGNMVVAGTGCEAAVAGAGADMVVAAGFVAEIGKGMLSRLVIACRMMGNSAC